MQPCTDEATGSWLLLQRAASALTCDALRPPFHLGLKGVWQQHIHGILQAVRNEGSLGAGSRRGGLLSGTLRWELGEWSQTWV